MIVARPLHPDLARHNAMGLALGSAVAGKADTAALTAETARATAAEASNATAIAGKGFPCTVNHTGQSAFVLLPGANWAIFGRAIGGGLITKIGLYIGVAGGNICVGTFTGPSGRSNPTTRTSTSGSVVCPAAGYAEVPLLAAVTMADGDWFALSTDSATAAFFASGIGAGTATEFGRGLAAIMATGFPLPASVVPTAARNQTIQLIGVA